MIIVEGCDNSGKTTLCNHLAEKFGLKVVHAGGPSKAEDCLSRLCEEQKSILDENIHDRLFMISEILYSKALDRTLLFDMKNYMEYIRYWESQGRLLVIYCRPDDEVLMDFSDHKVKEHETEEHVAAVIANQEKLIAVYDDFFSEGLGGEFESMIVYNFQIHEDLGVIESKVKRVLKRMRGEDLV